MIKNKLLEGDIFYVNYNEKYIFGRVLLDVSERVLKVEGKNSMWGLTGCYMVAVYEGVYDKPILESDEYIIPSAYTYKKYFYSKRNKLDWHFYKHEKVDYKQLIFPESILDAEKGISFISGELEIPISITREQYDKGGEFDIKRTIQGSYYTIIKYALYYQNREDLIEGFTPAILYDKQNLHFNLPARGKVYKMVNEDSSQSYYELALKYGFDLGRFYK